MRIAVVGSGYVGLVSATQATAERGYAVTIHGAKSPLAERDTT